MPAKDIRDDVRHTVLEAALAYELHQGKGEQWRLVFKRAISALPVKSGRAYKFLVIMSNQSREAMDKVCHTLTAGYYFE